MNKKIFIKVLESLGLEFDEHKITYEAAEETFLTEKKVIFLLDDGAIVADDLTSFKKNILLSKGEFYSFDGNPIKKFCIEGFDNSNEQMTTSDLEMVNALLNIGDLTDSQMKNIIESFDEEVKQKDLGKHLFEVENE